MKQHSLKLLYSADQIAVQVRHIAAQINREYAGRELLLVGVLKGSFLFIADLCRHLTPAVSIDFVRLASYGSDTHSSGIIEFRKDLEMPIKGKHVIIVEDIIDSGYTLQSLYHRLLDRNPASLKICTLLDKRSRREVEIEADFVGITMDDGFIVGYGLDYDENYRHLADIFLVENV
jgi:hypoxanthine phosphoribosyltransferase